MSSDSKQGGLEDKVIKIRRCASVVKGGRRFSFSALVVVGDMKSKVGFGVGKADEVPDAIKKASEQARKAMFEVAQVNGTLPFEVDGRFGASKVRMYPAKSGKGIIAGGAVRTIIELSGLKDVVCKIHGSKNAHNVVRAAVDGLGQMVRAEEYGKRLGRSVEEFLQVRRSATAKTEAVAQ